MSTADIVYEETEEQRIERWRSQELERAGFDQRSATELARRHDIDLHRAVDLLKTGCPPGLALKILL
jgi:hypothetical protein